MILFGTIVWVPGIGLDGKPTMLRAMVSSSSVELPSGMIQIRFADGTGCVIDERYVQADDGEMEQELISSPATKVTEHDSAAAAAALRLAVSNGGGWSGSPSVDVTPIVQAIAGAREEGRREQLNVRIDLPGGSWLKQSEDGRRWILGRDDAPVGIVETIEYLDATASNVKPEIVLIWSREHSAWWRPDGSGYTTCREEAGRYWLADARKRTDHCRLEKQIFFEACGFSPVGRRWTE